MTRARLSVAARAVTGALGLVVGVLSAAVAGGEVTDGATLDTTYGGVSTSFALLEVVVGIGLLAAGLLLLAERSTAVLGALAVAASTAWFAPVWIGWEGGPAFVRSLGLVVAPLLPAVVLAVAALLPPKPVGPRPRRAARARRHDDDRCCGGLCRPGARARPAFAIPIAGATAQ